MRKQYETPELTRHGSLVEMTGALGGAAETDQTNFPKGTELPEGTISDHGSTDACYGTGDNTSSGNDAGC